MIEKTLRDILCFNNPNSNIKIYIKCILNIGLQLHAYGDDHTVKRSCDAKGNRLMLPSSYSRQSASELLFKQFSNTLDIKEYLILKSFTTEISDL